jgi:hypothetical protein
MFSRTRTPLAAALLVLLFLSPLIGRAQTQSLFFQPPLYTAPGETVTADFNQDGKPDLASLNGTVLLGDGDGTFTTGTPLSLNGITPTLIATADFNGDGKPDILLMGSATSVYVFLGKGDGTFEPAVATNVGTAVTAFSAADVNGDGKADILALGPAGNSIALWEFIGNGDGTFAAGIQILNSSTIMGPLLLDDFTGDGKVDVAIASQGNTAAAIEVLLGNGNGTFQPPIVTSVPGFTEYGGGMVAGDFNGDHRLDLVVGLQTNLGPEAFALLGNGDGTFQPPVVAISVPQFNGPLAAAADLNGDGKTDLVLQDGLGLGFSTLIPFVEIFLSNGDGTFAAGDNYLQYGPVGVRPFGTVLIADFNGDHKPDLAAMGTMLLGNGDGTFQGNRAVYAGAFVETMAGTIGDFNGDGSPDVATLTDNLYIFLNDGTGKISLTHTYSLPNSVETVLATADLNGDGKLDLVAMTGNDYASFQLSTLLGNGDGSFGPANPFFNGTSTTYPKPQLALADFNGDHKPDLAVLSNDELAVFLNNGSGTFEAPVFYFAGAAPTSFVTGDFNNDGKIDIVVLSSAGIGLLLGNGDGTFKPPVFSIPGIYYAVWAAADLNHDGNVDLVAATFNGFTRLISILLGKGDGTFTPLPPTNLENGALYDTSLDVVDVNGDGVPDLVWGFAKFGYAQVQAALGNGDGTFGNQILIIPSSPNAFGGFTLVADLNHDSKPDLVVNIDNAVVTLLNVTQPGFTIAASPLSPAAVSAGASASSTVTVAPIYGFKGAVALSCSGLPNGAACSFSPPSVAGASGTSALTISTSASTPAGTYPVSVTGISGSLKQNVPVSLVVSGFSISGTALSPSSVAPGASATSTIKVAPLDGFNASVALSCSSITLNGSVATTVPPTCSFNPTSITNGSGTSTLTVSTIASSALLNPPAMRRSGLFYALWLPIGGLALIGAGLSSGSRNKKLVGILLVCLMLSGLIFLAACGGGGSGSGGGGGSGGTPAGTYTIIVKGTAGSTVNTTNVTLTVQ